MSRLIKMFWRLDFPVSYRFMDARGSVFSALTQTVPGFVEEAGDGNIPDSFVAKINSTDFSGAMSVETNSFNGSMDWYAHRDLGRIGSLEEIQKLNKVISELLRVCEIKAMNRVGVRPICLLKSTFPKEMSLEKRYLDNDFLTEVDPILGKVADSAIVLHGKTNDEISYKLHFGPLKSKNIEQYLPKVTDEQTKQLMDENDLVFDTDWYEHDISFQEHSFFRWAATKFEKASEFIVAATKMSETQK